MNIIIQTPRIIVREFQRQELKLVLEIDADERLTRYVKKRSAAESRRIFQHSLLEYKNATGLGRWGIFNVADNDFVGICMLKPSDYDGESIELGYRLHQKYWGTGIATELSKALISYGLEHLRLKEVCAVTHPENLASQRVLDKAGLIRDGTVNWYGEDELPFFKIRRSLS
ncbi:MAG: GNAT family N-acetyltransferase [Bacteroidota bacterium]|nr:GNAT family N-acetyltransferase [Bacteroidota bacterium]